MNYTKPEVAVLGEAVHVIESFPIMKSTVVIADGAKSYVTTAYDLDE